MFTSSSRASVDYHVPGQPQTLASHGLTKTLTFFGWQIVQVDQDGEVIARLRGHHVRPVFPVEDLLGTISHQVAIAPNLDRYHDLGLGLGC